MYNPSQFSNLKKRYDYADVLAQWARKEAELDARETEIARISDVAKRTHDPKSIELASRLASDVRNTRVAFEEAREKFETQIVATKAADARHEAAQLVAARGTPDAKQAIKNRDAVTVAEAEANYLAGQARGLFAEAEAARQRMGGAAFGGIDRNVIAETLELALDLAKGRSEAAGKKAERSGKEADAATVEWWPVAEKLAFDAFKDCVAEKRHDYDQTALQDSNGNRYHDHRRIPPTFATKDDLENLFRARRAAHEAERRRAREHAAALAGGAA